MSNSDYEEVGYGKPPKKHQFTKDKQPQRRRKRAPTGHSNNLHVHIMAALGEYVAVSENGKPRKAKASEILAKMLVKQGISGSVGDKLKLIKFLGDVGEFDLAKIRAELEQEYTQELERERERYAELMKLLSEFKDLFLEMDGRLTLVSDAFGQAKSRCSCDAFDDCSEVASAILEWAAELGADDTGVIERPTPEHMGWAPHTTSGPSGGGQANDDPTKVGNETPEDGLIAGMIGND